MGDNVSSFVEYVPPSAKEIDDYARRVCDAVGIHEREVRYGFASFLKLATKLLAKQLTDEHNIASLGENSDG